MLVGRRDEKGVVITPERTEQIFWWNPSITEYKKEVYVSFRGYEKQPEIWRGYRSLLGAAKLKDDKTYGFKTLTPKNCPETVMSNGIEDVRLWTDGKKLFGIGVILVKLPHNKMTVKLGLFDIDYDGGYYSLIEEYESPKGTPEKNWAPIDGMPHTYLYAISELVKDGWTRSTEPHPDVSIVHNGTPLIEHEGEYIGVFHQRVVLNGRIARYPNVFIKFNKDFRPTHRSGWFVFDDEAHQEVQFISGALKVKDEMWLTVGIDRITRHTQADYKGLLYKVKFDEIGWKDFNYHNFVIRRGRLV